MLPKNSAGVDSPATGATPVPDRGTVNGGLLVLVMVRAVVLLKAPADCGVKVTLMLHVAPPANPAVQVLAETAKLAALAPVIDAPLIASVPAPAAFETVTVCAVLVVFTTCGANVSAVGETLAFGVAPTETMFDQVEASAAVWFQVW